MTADGYSMLIFPEGGGTRRGHGRFRPGVA